MKNIAIFASGNGTNCEAIMKHFCNSSEICVALVITNNNKAKVIERAKNFNVPVRCLSKENINTPEIILPLLQSYNIYIIVLAGFMLFIPDFLISAYPQKIVNIHPSLLPKYGGKGMYGINVHKAVKDNEEKETGITIHYVNNQYDSGERIAQFSTRLLPTDDVDAIANKVHALEYAHYPIVIEQLLSKR